MARCAETIELDVLHRSSSSLEEESGIQNSIGDNGTEDHHLLSYRPSKSSNMEQRFNSLTALEILRETIRILRFDPSGFLVIAALFICPVSAILLSNAFVDQSVVDKLSFRFRLVAEVSGLPKGDFTKLVCWKLSESVLSLTFCFPFLITLWLFSKAAIVHSVAGMYAGKKLTIAKFITMIRKIWKRVMLTYIWVCIAIIGCIAVFLLLLVIVINVVVSMGICSSCAIYAVLGLGVIFSVLFAHTLIICNLANVISIMEDCRGSAALFRSMYLIKGRTQVGLMIILGTAIGTAFVESLYEHRVKSLNYGDVYSRIWEGPLLVIMYSFVVLIDAMMSCIFYFTCKCSSSESFDNHSLLEHTASFSGSTEQTNGNDSSPSKVLLGS